MSGLESIASAWFAAAWRTSWQAAVLALLIFFITRALRGRLSSRWTYVLWGLVALRLAIPASPRIALGAFDWDAATGTSEVTAPVELATLPHSLPSAPATLRPMTPRVERNVLPPTVEAEEPAQARPTLSQFANAFAKQPANEGLVWTTWAFLIWLTGALAKLTLVTIQELGFRRRLRREKSLQSPELIALLDECCADLGIDRPVRLVQSELTSSPALSGWRRPVILLPEHVTRLDRDDLRGVLLHELSHAKHADVPANALLALLACVWWFHPLVAFTFGELRTARESLRDHEALSTPRSPAPLSYAETLLALVEARPQRARLAPGFSLETRETRRRIQMIANFRTHRPATHALGAGLLMGLAWLTFTSAASTALVPGEPAAKAQDSVRVVRHHPAPPWRTQLTGALDKGLSVEFSETSGHEVVEFLRQTTGANFIVQPDLFEDHGMESVTFSVVEARVRDVLNLLCEEVGSDVTYTLTNRVVYIGERGNIPVEHDLRFYKVDPLLEAIPDEDDGMDQLMDLVRMLSAEDTWDEEGVSIESWNGLMLVTQSDEGHEEVQGLLDRLLRGGQQSPNEDDLRRAAVAKRLRETKTSVSFDELPVDEAVEHLTQISGISIRADDWFQEDIFSLVLNDVSVEEILSWLAMRKGAQVVVDPTGVRLSQLASCSLEFYDIHSLQARSEDVDELHDSLENLILNQVEPDLWDADPTSCLLFWDRYMLVRATESAHVGIGQLLKAIEEVTK